MLLVALEYAGIGQVVHIARSAIRTQHLTIWPAKRDHEGFAVLKIGEVDDRFLESGWYLFHTTTVKSVGSQVYFYHYVRLHRASPLWRARRAGARRANVSWQCLDHARKRATRLGEPATSRS